MSKEVKVILNDKEYRQVVLDENIESLGDLSKYIFKDDYRKYLGARINNTIYNLHTRLEDGMEIEFIDIGNKDGHRIFVRTLSAVYIKACEELFPERTVKIEHSLGSGLYTSFEDGHTVNFKDIDSIKAKMQEIIDADYEIVREKQDMEKVIDYFEKKGGAHKVRLFKTLEREETDVYTIDGFKDTYHGYLAPSTGYIYDFDLRYYYPGLVILFPNQESPEKVPEYKEQAKLAKVFEESNKWAEILDLEYLGSLNEKINQDKISEVIRISEALHEKKIAKIADEICQEDDVNIILIAGPSSSGKTTFANRLSIHLKVNGKRPIIMSMDDYFVNREDTPLNKDGSYDFEALEAIDLDSLSEDLITLLEGGEIELPKFNFLTGKREMSGKFIKVDKDHPIILEGIHALNPKIAGNIPNKNKYKIYISALTQLNIDAHNRIPTTDTRLIRRMVRDHKYRGNDPIRTFDLWAGVRRGEEKHIFPYQEEADTMFDSALVYELGILKKYAVPLLETVGQESEHYSEARKLIRFLDYFKSIEDETAVPPNSILREFIGGADKNVH